MFNNITLKAGLALFAGALTMITVTQPAAAVNHDWPDAPGDDPLLCHLTGDPWFCGIFCPFYGCMDELDPSVSVVSREARFNTRKGDVKLFETGGRIEISNERGGLTSLKTRVTETPEVYSVHIAVEQDHPKGEFTFNFYRDDTEYNKQTMQRMMNVVETQFHQLSIDIEPGTAEGPKFNECMLNFAPAAVLGIFGTGIGLYGVGFCLVANGHVVDDD